MSGDVQPRKRKDKKKKKDDLGTEEPRGTAAALGEGDVFMHSYQDHGTGGHWCAKIIFFSLLAVLVTLIGLIILENRGLTELEANSVESRYSGVLEGWIEDAIDDHHDEHSLELKHHDDDEDHFDDQLNENEAEKESIEEEVDHNDDDESNEDEGESDEMEDEDDTQNEDDDDDEEDERQNYEDGVEDDDDEEDERQNDEDGVEDDDDKEDERQNDEDGVEDDDDEEDERQNDEDGIEDDDDEEDERQNDEDGIEDDDDEEDENHNNEDEDEGQDEDSDEDDGKYDEIEENIKNEDDEETDEHYSYEDIKSNDNDDEDDDKDMEEQKDDYLSKEMTSHHESDEDGDDESKETRYDVENEHNTEDAASEEEDGDDDDDEQEIEKIEKEFNDGDDSEEIVDTRASASKEKRDTSKEAVKEDTSKEDEGDEPPIEKISRPQAGKPFIEIEEETPVKPVDTLAEEEAYERQQEELRRQEEEAPHSLWLKLCVGGALLAATHALVRRATRVDAPENEEPVLEETPSLTDRRMTIIDEPIRVTQTSLSQTPRQIIDEEVFKKPAPVAQSAPIAKQKIEEEIVKEVVAKVLELPKSDAKKEEEKELYSEEEDDEEEDVEEDHKLPQKVPANNEETEDSDPEQEPEEVSDVEIIYDETVEEEEIPDEEIEEEEISDVDDAELLSRLEAKYGRLPEPERPGQYKGGGNSLETEWPGEPSDPYWRAQLDTAEEEFRQGRWAAAAELAGGGGLGASGRARWLRARALDRAADSARDNRLLADAVAAYLHLLKMNEALSDEKLLQVARRTVDRIQFRGTYLRAEPVYRLLIRRFPDEVNYRNNLTILFLMANRADLADEVLGETLRLWPNDRVALAHHGFVLKIHHNKLEEAVRALRKALDGDAGLANEPRFYYHLGDALLMLGRLDEAHEVHKRGTELGHFPSPSQRSLYNVPRLRARPWWRVEETPYAKLARALEESWRDILREGEAAVALYEQEKEGLKERGEWSQLDIFARGREVGGRCARAPAVCAALRGERCRRGQVKFSLMAPGTHVRPHVGPTNCRLRMHLALSNTRGTYIRVDKEIRQWRAGKTLIFDDSFEHEVWHNGTGPRLVLIVDVWHPDLTAAERRQLPAI